jgi:methyl-accepting chemotaxis protein
MTQLPERLAKLEQRVTHAEGELKHLEDKKLSKHEFNGFQQLVESMKVVLTDAIKSLRDNSDKLGESTENNTMAIANLQKSFESGEQYLRTFLKLVAWFGGIITTLLLVIAGLYAKQLGIEL